MTSQDGFHPHTDPYASAHGAHRAPDAGEPETLYATPVGAPGPDAPPPSGRPYQVPGGSPRAGARPHGHERQADRRPQGGAPSFDQQDFERLCHDIGRGVTQVSDALAKGLSGAGGALGDAIGQAVQGYRENQARAQEQAELARQQAMQQAIMDARFRRSGSARTGGILCCTFGGLLTFSFGVSLIALLPAFLWMEAYEWVVGTCVVGAFFVGSLALLLNGVKRLKTARQLDTLRRIMGTKEAVPIAEIARMTGQRPEKIVSALQKLIAKGYLPQGRLDDGCTTLMVTDGAYERYRAHKAAERAQRMEQRAQRAAVKAAPPAGDPKVPADGLSPEARAFLESGNGYLRRFRELDVDIADEAVSQRIRAIEGVVGRILARAKEEPAVISQLGRFVDYYLPTTVKLLSAYDALEEQTVQGDNIESSRREIEATLDTLLSAYEKLLDATFADLSLDVSSEISVLNTVLAQEGLTQSPFDAFPDEDQAKG